VSKFSLVFLLVFLAGIYQLIIVSPVWGFYLYELVYFLNPPSRWWFANLPSLSYSFTTALLIYLVFFLKHKGKSENRFADAPSVKWLIILMFIYCAVYYFAMSKEIHSDYLYDHIKLTILVLVAYKLLDSVEKIEKALFAFIIGGAYLGYEAYTRGRNMEGRVEDIGTVDMPDANGTSAIMVPLIPILTYFFWRKGWKVKLFIVVTGALIANGLVLINSRGAFLGSLAGFLYLTLHVYFSKYRLPKQRLMLMAILLAVVAGAIRFTDDTFWDRMATISESSKDNETDSGGRRINFWLATFDMIADHPFGVGVYGYEILAPEYLPEHLLGEQSGTRAVHSSWFQVLSETGYWGALTVFFLFLSLFRHLRQAKRHAIKNGFLEQYYLLLAIQSGLLGFWVSISFISAFRAEVHLWMLMYCMAISTVILRMEPDRSN
jgi:hypothetical protein